MRGWRGLEHLQKEESSRVGGWRGSEHLQKQESGRMRGWQWVYLGGKKLPFILELREVLAWVEIREDRQAS